MLKTPKLILEVCEWSESIANRSKRSFGGIKRLKQNIFYIGTGILKFCENAKISNRGLQKVELGYQNAKKETLYHLRYPDIHKIHKIPARQKKKKKKNILTFCIASDQCKML